MSRRSAVTRSSDAVVRSAPVASQLLHVPTHQRPLDESAEGHPYMRVATDVHSPITWPTSLFRRGGFSIAVDELPIASELGCGHPFRRGFN